MTKIKDYIEAKLHMCSIKAEYYLYCWQEALSDMQECMLSDEFGDYKYLEQTCMYYERKYLEASKNRHEYMITGKGLGLI